MAKCGLLLVLFLILSISHGFVLKTTPANVQVMNRDGHPRVVSTFIYDVASEIRGHVLKKIRTILKVAPEYLESSNSTWTMYLTCPKYDSEVFHFSPLTLVKQYRNTTELYLEFSIEHARCSECVKEGVFNLTVSLYNEDIRANTFVDKTPFSVQTMEAYFQGTNIFLYLFFSNLKIIYKFKTM